MGSSRYRVHILVRIALMVLNCYAITYVLHLDAFYWTLVNLILLLLLQIFLLFRFLTRWQKDIRVFANGVNHGDYSITYQLLERSDVHYELYEMLNKVSRYVRELKANTEQRSQYFRYVVENAQVGLIAFDNAGQVVLVNQEALLLLGVDELQNLEQIRRLDAVMYDHFQSMELNRSRLALSSRDRKIKLSVRRSAFVIDGQPVNLLSLMNIRPELEENELQSWQELISVLTHEIINSVTPIHSLNSSMAKYLDRIQGNEEVVGKARTNLEVINRRSQALMNFVDRYRKIGTVPLPRKETFRITPVIDHALMLLQNDLNGITVHVRSGKESITADKSQLEQILINVLKNAASAVQSSEIKSIDIHVSESKDALTIEVLDSGAGIPDEVLDKIFIPFFTTREGGSGIGLTLSRQMMQRHDGSIEIARVAGGGTRVTLTFPIEN